MKKRRLCVFERLLSLLVLFSVCAVCAMESNKASRKHHTDTNGKRSKHSSNTTNAYSRSELDRNIHSGQLGQTSSADDPKKSDARKIHFKEAFDSSLEHIFRMKTRPECNLSRIRIPDYMMTLYNEQLSSDEEPRIVGRSSNVTTGRRKRESFPAANTIRSFNSEELSSELFDPRLHLRFQFDVSSIPSYETISGTELRINYHSAIGPEIARDNATSTVTNATSPRKRRPRLKISVYMVTEPNSGLTHQSRLLLPRILDSQVIRQSPCHSCWASFDVTKAVNIWRQSSSTNRGLKVVISEVQKERKKERSTPSSMCDMAYTFPGNYCESNDVEYPLLIVYSNDGKTPVAKTSPDLPPKAAKKRHKKRSPSSTGFGATRQKKKGRCRRWPLYVDFTEVGWNDWIVAPAGYQAYYCQGECPYYLPDSLNSTNHAVVQTLVHSINPQAVPKPCCVPTELSPISMLYIDNSEKVVIKNYQDMVVEACGCR